MKNAIGNFIEKHPFLTYWLLASVVAAPANIIKALKWDGHEGNNSLNVSLPNSEESNSDESTEGTESTDEPIDVEANPVSNEESE